MIELGPLRTCQNAPTYGLKEKESDIENEQSADKEEENKFY